jgi:hypothetical protein
MLKKARFFVALLLSGTPAAVSADLVDNRANQTIIVPEMLNGRVNVLAGGARADDCDDIRLNALPRSGSLTTVRLRTGRGTWGKKVEVYESGIRRGTVEAPGDGGTSSTPVPIANPHTAQLLLLKPKFLGVMAGVYQIAGLGRFTNFDLEIVWERDRC